MIDLNSKKVLFAIKIFDINIKMFFKKLKIILIFEINNFSIYIIIILIDQDITLLFSLVCWYFKFDILKFLYFF